MKSLFSYSIHTSIYLSDSPLRNVLGSSGLPQVPFRGVNPSDPPEIKTGKKKVKHLFCDTVDPQPVEPLSFLPAGPRTFLFHQQRARPQIRGSIDTYMSKLSWEVERHCSSRHNINLVNIWENPCVNRKRSQDCNLTRLLQTHFIRESAGIYRRSGDTLGTYLKAAFLLTLEKSTWGSCFIHTHVMSIPQMISRATRKIVWLWQRLATIILSDSNLCQVAQWGFSKTQSLTQTIFPDVE